jgi:hypothetical protein
MSKTYNVVHTIKLVTEFNLDHPSTKGLISMAPEQLEQLCQGAFVGLVKGQGWLEKANESGSWAVLRFAEDGE